MINVFIVDDHFVLREALRGTLEDEPDLAVSGEAASGAEALRALAGEASASETPAAEPSAGAEEEDVGSADPDVVLVDVAMPEMSGVELARELRAARPDLRVVMLSGHGETSYVEKAREAGAQRYVLKGKSERLLSTIRAVARGKPWVENLS